jgi:hypothetical protein
MLHTALRSRRPPTFTSRLLSNRAPVQLSSRLVGLVPQLDFYSGKESFHETSARLYDTRTAAVDRDSRLGQGRSLLGRIVAMR